LGLAKSWEIVFQFLAMHGKAKQKRNYLCNFSPGKAKQQKKKKNTWFAKKL